MSSRNLRPRSPRLLSLSTVVLIVVGSALLCVPHGQEPPATTSHPATDPASATAAAPAGQPVAGTTASTMPTASTHSVHASALPPHGEGVAGDRAVQQNLAAAWPADLSAADEKQLLTTGRALLRADTTGVGRARWPTIFPNSGGPVAPAFATVRFRIQAAIARREGSPDKAVVHLVWAGTDRGGTFTDLNITDWHFRRTVTKGTTTWIPQPRT